MKYLASIVPLLLLALTACQSAPPANDSASEPLLAEAFDGTFLIGGALGEHVFSGQSLVDSAIAATQFNTITPENVLKWEAVHPQPDEYNFAPGDQFVAFGEANDMFIVGHTLVWHSQTPAWVFQDENGAPLDREGLLARMEDHISTVVGRYKGRIGGWDVVNEALNDDGTLRQTPWLNIIGEDYLQKAFEFARAADPDAELYYNDYSLFGSAKRQGAIRLIKSIQAAGIRVDGVGEQGHYTMGGPSFETLDSTLTDLAGLGIKVMITELDVDVLPRENLSAEISINQAYHPEYNPYTEGITPEADQAHADRYKGYFDVFVRHADHLERVTFWGVTDGSSWLNGWPVPGRTNYPLLFGRDGQPKAAFHSVMSTAPVR